MGVFVSKCSATIQIPHIQTALTKHIQVAALGHKMLTVLASHLQMSPKRLTVSTNRQ